MDLHNAQYYSYSDILVESKTLITRILDMTKYTMDLSDMPKINANKELGATKNLDLSRNQEQGFFLRRESGPGRKLYWDQGHELCT